MKQYLDLLQDILANGSDKPDRTGTGVRSVFGRQIRFDLREGFPIVTTKKVHFKSLVHELLWFLRGDTNVKYLKDNGVNIWNEWANADGDLGPVYGAQWVRWQNYDGTTTNQIQSIVETLKKDPWSRRLVLSAWNVSDLPKMALSPCHCLVQFFVDHNKRLSCQLYQRSADVFLGVPFNISSYALLTHMVAHATGLEVGDYVHTFGDVHIYSNHFEQIAEQLKRDPKPLPKLELNPDVKNVFEFTFDDIKLVDYVHHPGIKAPVAI